MVGERLSTRFIIENNEGFDFKIVDMFSQFPPEAIAPGDFNGDGVLDFVLLYRDTTQLVYIGKSIDTSLNLPPQPTLISPINDAIVGKSPSLSWANSDSITSNQLQVAVDVNFESVIVTENDILVEIVSINHNRILSNNLGRRLIKLS